MPLVSCWVATADRPGLVRRAVRCALSQTGVDVEVLILDDGPEPAVLDEGDLVDPRVHYHREFPRRSLALKRNRLAALSRGEFFTSFDDDDWSRPGRVAAQLAALEAAPRAIACHLGPRLVCHDLDTGLVWVACLALGQWDDCSLTVRRSAWRTLPDEWQALRRMVTGAGGAAVLTATDDLSLVVSGIDNWNRHRRRLEPPRWMRWEVAPERLYDGTAPWHDAPTRYGR